MKIQEFAIRRYGPLADSGLIRLTNFNLFWGENEDGKTLTLEALIRLLLGKGRRVFPGIDRVREKPDGYLIMENAIGQEFKLPDDGRLTDLLKLSPEECRNLFIIRNSDLSISRESEFYGNITERLTGLRIGKIKRVKEHLRDSGYFTETLDTINTRQSNYLKNRLAQTRALIEEADVLFQRAQSQGYDAIEENLVRLQKYYNALSEEVNALEKARMRERYEKGRSQLKTIARLLSSIETLRSVSEEELTAWQEAEAAVRDRESEKERVFEQYRAQKAEMADEEQRRVEYQSQVQMLQKKKSRIDDSLRPVLRKLGDHKAVFRRIEAGKPFFRTLLLASLSFSVLLLVALIGSPHPYLMLGAGATGTATFSLALYYYIRFIKPTGRLGQLEQKLVNRAHEVGIAGDDAEQIEEQLQRLEDSFQRHQQRLSACEGRVAYLKSSCYDLRNHRLQEIDGQIQKARLKIGSLQSKHGIDRIALYQDRLEERKAYEQRLKATITVLRSQFGIRGDSIPEWLHYWQKEIDALAEYEHEAGETEFDDKLFDRKRDEQRRLETDIEQLQRQMRDFRERLSDLERRATEAILPEEDLFPCRSLNDLQELQRMLQNFQETIESEQYASRLALEIFEEVERLEKQKVGMLFGEESEVSRLYREITEGLYHAVFYEPNESAIQVERKDGKRLPPNWLSSGAYDQLYFVIRLALGEKLLNQEQGFFILDDPFLKSDTERLHRQLDALLNISERGWQIIYFSAKDEVKQALQNHIDHGRVSLQPLSGVNFKMAAP